MTGERDRRGGGMSRARGGDGRMSRRSRRLMNMGPNNPVEEP